MPIEIHNFVVTEIRLVQVETQSHHINGILDEMQNVRRSSNLPWDAIYSAYYECEADETITFYESEFVEGNKPGVWTYIFYDCQEGQEEIVSNSNIDVLVALNKVQEEINRRKGKAENLLPNAENAVVDIRKLRDYCLNQKIKIMKLVSIKLDCLPQYLI